MRRIIKFKCVAGDSAPPQRQKGKYVCINPRYVTCVEEPDDGGPGTMIWVETMGGFQVDGTLNEILQDLSL